MASGDGSAAGNGQVFVLLPADITGGAVGSVRERLLLAARDPATMRVVVDCRDVERLGAASLTPVVAAAHEAARHGARVELVHPSDGLLRLLGETGLSRVLTIAPDDFPARPWSELA